MGYNPLMEVLRTPQEVQAWRRSLPAGQRVAFVPTMGFLHEGHLSLMREGRRRVPVGQGKVVISIFVNPTQFGEAEDLDKYPRDEAGDLAKAESCGVDVAFCPTDPDAMYPTRNTWVDVEGLSEGLCGASRPGHFRGVCTVVAKLWNVVRPDVGIFGEKDYQQLAILRRMHADLFLDGEVASMPIVREADGLALSSRNARLSPDERREALAIMRYLEAVRAKFEAGERDVNVLRGDPEEALRPGRVDYAELVDASSLQPVSRVDAPTLVAVAAHFGPVRLIDNTVLRP
jgi:pantoate--beta-alanine ligase